LHVTYESLGWLEQGHLLESRWPHTGNTARTVEDICHRLHGLRVKILGESLWHACLSPHCVTSF
jgi:hypothetical protein